MLQAFIAAAIVEVTLLCLSAVYYPSASDGVIGLWRLGISVQCGFAVVLSGIVINHRTHPGLTYRNKGTVFHTRICGVVLVPLMAALALDYASGMSFILKPKNYQETKLWCGILQVFLVWIYGFFAFAFRQVADQLAAGDLFVNNQVLRCGEPIRLSPIDFSKPDIRSAN